MVVKGYKLEEGADLLCANSTTRNSEVNVWKTLATRKKLWKQHFQIWAKMDIIIERTLGRFLKLLKRLTEWDFQVSSTLLYLHLEWIHSVSHCCLVVFGVRVMSLLLIHNQWLAFSVVLVKINQFVHLV